MLFNSKLIFNLKDFLKTETETRGVCWSPKNHGHIKEAINTQGK